MHDELQRYAYSTSGVTLQQINEEYRRIAGEYGIVDADDPRTEMYGWYEIPHTFTSPMYYISYAVSALPALELFALQQESPEDALDVYLRAAAMSDEEYYLSEALSQTGLSNQMLAPDSSIPDAIRASGVLDVG